MNDPAQPSNLKEAAARLILGEIVPLVEKVDASAASLAEIHKFLQEDLQRMGALVTTFDHAATDATEQFRYLIDQARLVQTAIARFDAAPKEREPKIGLKHIALVAVISSLLATGLAVSAVFLLNSSQSENARIGKAVTKALPLLDADTRQKLQNAVNKAGS
jgi:predicted metal-dependent enzyme (double-stranded beta helix superfamily)